MAETRDPSADVLRGIWQQDTANLQDLDAECSPTKTILDKWVHQLRHERRNCFLAGADPDGRRSG